MRTLTAIADDLRRYGWDVSMEAAGMIFAAKKEQGEWQVEWCIREDGRVSVDARAIGGSVTSRMMVPIDKAFMEQFNAIMFKADRGVQITGFGGQK